MTREQMVQLLKADETILEERFGVTDLALFGSMARGKAREGSDLDILVAFDGPATSRRYFGVQLYLEDLLGAAPVDLVTEKALRGELRPYVDRDAIHVRFDRVAAGVAVLCRGHDRVCGQVPRVYRGNESSLASESCGVKCRSTTKPTPTDRHYLHRTGARPRPFRGRHYRFQDVEQNDG